MPFAKQIGQRILAKRLALGMSQQQVADRLGLTAAQIGRYERGVDMISANRLGEIAMLFGVSPGVFYSSQGAGEEDGVTDELTKLLKDPMALRLLRAFATIRGKKYRAQVLDWVEAFATRHATTGWSRHKQVGL
jgi:transcriptional regulator with XRE-family HTH domain